jgi:NAD(P)H-hydrate epimerase
VSVKPLSKSELRASLVAREADDHKGVFGHVLIVAGSRGMAGAAILAARGALRSGAGLVTVASPVSAASIVAGAVPSAMTIALPENAAGAFRAEGVDRLKEYARERKVVTMAIGPGVTTNPDAAKFVLLALAGVPAGAVVDADALNILAAQDNEGVREMLKSRKQPCVYTPHPAEASRLLGVRKGEVEGQREKSAERLARAFGGVALLKGRGTLIASGSRVALNPTGGPALAKAGSGDVLAGLIAGLWAQSIASGRVKGDLPFQAAALGAWLHGAAGDAAGKAQTPWAATSSDLPDFLPAAFKALCA